MKFLAPFLLLSHPLSAPRQQKAPTLDQKRDVTTNQRLKAISTPMAPYPEEALKKGIEGKVTLRIVVDAKGKVSQAKVLSGPPELVPAAIASVKMWKFEPPFHAPVTKTTSISYGHPKECPGPISDSGEVTGGGGLVDQSGKLVAIVSGDFPWPRYPEAERKAGVGGKMVLSVTLDPDGRVKEIHVIRSLSPALDKMAIDAVRPVRFKLIGSPSARLDDLRVQFVFLPICYPAPE